MSERAFWRSVALILGVLLGLSVIINLSGAFEIPRQTTLFLFGALLALGVGYSVVSPKSSPVAARRADEPAFRRRQYAAGFVISIVIAGSFVFEAMRDSPLIWLLCPVMVLPPALVVRDYVINRRRARRCDRPS